MRRALWFVAASVFFADVAHADADAGAKRADAQGIAVVARGAAKDEAFELARAVYASSLRPRELDEVRARVLAGDTPPANATRELRELAEVRAAIGGDDAASRRLLAGIAHQVHAQALLVVEVPSFEPPDPEDAGEAGTPPPARTPSARLFLADTEEFDAARYEPEQVEGGRPSWRTVVVSLERRFPPPEAAAVVTAPATKLPPPVLPSERTDSKPFYLSGWFWGAIAGAALVGGTIFFLSRDTADDTIHVDLRVPR